MKKADMEIIDTPDGRIEKVTITDEEEYDDECFNEGKR